MDIYLVIHILLNLNLTHFILHSIKFGHVITLILYRENQILMHQIMFVAGSHSANYTPVNRGFDSHVGYWTGKLSKIRLSKF